MVQAARSTEEVRRVRKDFSQVRSTILLFTARYADNCYFTYPIWVRFANKFTTDKVQVVEVDCSRFPQLARAFKINTSGVGQ